MRKCRECKGLKTFPGTKKGGNTNTWTICPKCNGTGKEVVDVREEVEIAKDFYCAYKTENLMLWGRCCELWDAEPRKNTLSEYVNRLRSAFWHNGTEEDIKKCKREARSLYNFLHKIFGEKK